ncbi:MAG TPA: DUF3570 domain-containing protein [Polyangiaceae bacterium]|nr:DUF3570 domain-containing protein [Polyangiaceae bacterium]
MQLIHRAVRAFGVILVAAAVLVVAAPARAQVVQFDTTHGLYYEAPLRTHMFVYTPSATLTANPSDWLSVNAGWEADVVSGASVATKAGPAYQATQPSADVISTASVHDFRNVGRGGFTVKKDNTSFGAGGLYSTENDYRSVSFNVMARTELYEHNTQLELDYAHNFDDVCDLVQDPNALPAGRLALPSSQGCFNPSDKTRTQHDIAIDNLQGTWSQALTPVFQMQGIYTLQIVNGFQSDPYRSVQLGAGLKAQEYTPQNRYRHSVAVRGNYFMRGLKAALRVGLRGYWDTWNIASGTVELEFEKYLTSAFRLGANGRLYKQTGAIFWSDDYTGGAPPQLGPKGQYFTGDRELSPFFSFMVGVKGTYAVAAAEKKVLGFMTDTKLVVAANFMQFNYDEYTLGGQSLGDVRAYLLNIGFSAGF